MGIIPAVLGIVATVGSAVSAADNARRTANATKDAANQADPAAFMRPQFQQWLQDNWGKLATTDSTEIMKDPSFRFQMEEGNRAIQNFNSSVYGSRRNGTLPEDLAKFNAGLFSNFTQQQFTRNMALLGLAGNFSGLTSGNPGMAGQLALQGQGMSNAADNNMWQQIGGGLEFVRKNPGIFSGGSPGGNTNWAQTGGTPYDPNYGGP